MTTAADTSALGAVTGAQLARWLDAYGRAWETRDGERAARLFTDDADYRWGPFDALRGRAQIAQRWAAATSDQRDIHFEHTPLAIADGCAFAHWRTTFHRVSTRGRCELDGVFVLRFDDGLCSELREWWLAREEAPS